MEQAVSIPADAKSGQMAIGESAESSWNFFDRIYCISLVSRPDRRKEAHDQFSRVGLADKVEFVIVEKHPCDSEQGIYESHLECLRRGIDAGAQTIVVFEDDILFHRFSARSLRRVVRFMKENPGWRLFFFGCFVNAWKRTAFASIAKIRFRCNAHAYVIERQFAQMLIGQPWRGIAYDDMLRAVTGDGAYSVYPAFAYQSDSRTDNDKQLKVDRIRRLLGGVRILQRWNEFSSRYLIELIIAHVFIIAGLIALAWFLHFER